MATKRNINWMLPADIIHVILSKVDFVNLPSCRLVCKTWNNLILSCKFDPPILISNLLFAYTLPSRNVHCVDFDPKHSEGMSSVASFSLHPSFSSRLITVVNFCNGLFCFLISKKTLRLLVPHVFCICNPMTNEYITFPLEKLKALDGGSYRYGLGFSPKTKQYKVARISFVPEKSLVEIFRFGTSGDWTPVGVLPSHVTEEHGVYFNGGLYWIGEELNTHDFTNVIYRLDIENEKLETISFPQNGEGIFFLGVFDGTLYLTISTGFISVDKYHVWKMEEDFSWIKQFVLPKPKELRFPNHPRQPIGSCQLQPIKPCEDGKILCLIDGLDLILYDPKNERVDILTDQDVEIKKQMFVHQIDSFNFNSLNNILPGNC